MSIQRIAFLSRPVEENTDDMLTSLQIKETLEDLGYEVTTCYQSYFGSDLSSPAKAAEFLSGGDDIVAVLIDKLPESSVQFFQRLIELLYPKPKPIIVVGQREDCVRVTWTETEKPLDIAECVDILVKLGAVFEENDRALN